MLSILARINKTMRIHMIRNVYVQSSWTRDDPAEVARSSWALVTGAANSCDDTTSTSMVELIPGEHPDDSAGEPWRPQRRKISRRSLHTGAGGVTGAAGGREVLAAPARGLASTGTTGGRDFSDGGLHRASCIVYVVCTCAYDFLTYMSCVCLIFLSML